MALIDRIRRRLLYPKQKTEMQHAYGEAIAAFRDGHLEKVKAVFKKFPELRSPENAFLGSWMYYAASQGNLNLVKLLLQLGWDVNEGDRLDGCTALNGAVSAGSYLLTEFLLDNGANIDVSASIKNPLFGAITESVQTNALHHVPTGEAEQIIRLLLDRGIEAAACYCTPTMVDMDAAAFACMWGRQDFAWIILNHIYDGRRDLMIAAFSEALEVASWNARTRQRFRKRRYPSKSNRQYTVHDLASGKVEYWLNPQ